MAMLWIFKVESRAIPNEDLIFERHDFFGDSSEVFSTGPPEDHDSAWDYHVSHAASRRQGREDGVGVKKLVSKLALVPITFLVAPLPTHPVDTVSIRGRQF